MRAFFLLAIILLATKSVEALECKVAEYKLSRDLTVGQIKSSFSQIDRDLLVQMAWGEMLKPQKKSMVTPLLHYLAGTEDNADRHGYFRTMLHLVTGDNQPMSRIKIWPQRGEIRKSPFNLQRLCELYR
ncbi:MAG: hypothetical protein H6624_14880 [Bdellovibrionaceae bacterium]|nr:hypothetical protein [Pseudobdellovibrionaceae bacterium]